MMRWHQWMDAKAEAARAALEVRELKEDKELVEERLETMRANSGEGSAASAEGYRALDDEERRLREKEEARRANESLRLRTQEAEVVRSQVTLAVQEANQLRADLVAARASEASAVKRATEAEIEMEIWRERGVKWKAYLAELAK